MSTVVIAASPGTYLASLGLMSDAFAKLAEAYATNDALGSYAAMHTQTVLRSTCDGDIQLAGGRRLPADGTAETHRQVRLVYLPAFQFLDEEMLDRVLAASKDCHAWLRRQAAAVIGASGASVFHLAAAGLLDTAEVTVPARWLEGFGRRYPNVRTTVERPICVDGPILTCSDEASEAALVTRLIAHAFSIGVAQVLALRNDRARDEELTPLARDTLVASAQLWIAEHFTEDFRIADMASSLGVTHQTLIRRFREAVGTAPGRYTQQIRANAAAMMLQETNRTVTEIAALVGYADTPSFRRVFMTLHGLTPSAFRQRVHHGIE